MNDKEYKDDDVVIIGGSGWQQHDQKKKKGNDASKIWKIAAISLAAILIIFGGFFLGKHVYYHFQFNRSRPDIEILSQLSNPMQGEAGISMEEQEAMGVKMKIYALSGLKAHFADSVPDYTDSSVYFITRSSDYKIKDEKKQIIGDYIKDGEIISESLWRAGFMVIQNGNAQIGISRSKKIGRYVSENKGSMFRQLALVAAGTTCKKQYILKGKVTRCAYARDLKGSLYFIETVNPETLYGFADALIEYGFIDAIYITGGSQPDRFFRESDGTAHGAYFDDKPHEMVVWSK